MERKRRATRKAPKRPRKSKATMIQPGEVRNPLGINRKRPWTDRYYERSEAPLPENSASPVQRLGMEVLPPGSTWADAGTLRQHMDAMMEGGTKAAKEIADRVEGKPPQRMEIQGTERKEITLTVRYEKRNQLSSG